MLQKKILSAVRNCSLFEGLTEREREDVLRDGQIRQVSAKKYLFRYGDPVAEFFIVGAGVIRAVRTAPDGHEKTTDILSPGSMLGEREILGEFERQQFNAQAVDTAAVMSFPASWLKESAVKHGRLLANLLVHLSRRAAQAELEAEHQAQGSAVMLVACFFRRLCLANNFDPRGFDLPYSKALIATRLGMESETFSRTLTKLRAHGVKIQGKRVAFEDLDKLETYICSLCSVADTCPTRKAIHRKG